MICIEKLKLLSCSFMAEASRDVVFYYRGTTVFAIRKGPYKAHFITQPEYGSRDKTKHDPPLLYNLEVDPSEKYDIAGQHPEVIAGIKKILEAHQASLKPVENQLEIFLDGWRQGAAHQPERHGI